MARQMPGLGLGTGRAAEQMAKRLSREQARTGEITVSLVWNSLDDLDLHCTGPAGGEIYYGCRRGACGGELDVDMNACRPYHPAPVENIYWAAAPKGRYRIWVQNYCHRTTPAEIEFTCILRRKGMAPEQVSRGLQLRYLRRIPAAAVS